MSLSNTIYGHPRDTSGAVVDTLQPCKGCVSLHHLCDHQSNAYDYNHSTDASILHRLCICQSTRYSLPSSVSSLLDTVNNHLRDDAILLHHSCSCQSIRNGLQSSKGRASLVSLVQSSVNWVRLQLFEGYLFEVPLVQSSVYRVQSTIIQEIPFSCTARAFVSLSDTVYPIQPTQYSLSDTVYNHLRDVFLLQSPVPLIRSTIIQGMMPFSSTICAVVSLSETVYNHPRDALLLCSYQPTGYGYNYLKDAFLRFRLCSHRLTGYGLQSSEG